jgi:hypothetical protein
METTSVQKRGRRLVPGMPRVEQPELLDLGHGTPADVAANLAEMWRINRVLGGLPSLTRHLYPRLAACTGEITIADLGTGSAEIPVQIAQWAQQRGLDVRIIGVDWAARNLTVARQHITGTPQVSLIRADAGNLPIPPEGVDYVISTLFLHHFTPDQVIRLLHGAYTAARRGIIMSDLVRGWMPLIGFRLIQPIFARNPLTRHDGALSIRRAYTPDELRALAEAAGITGARITTHWPWRMTLIADKGLISDKKAQG